MTNIIEDDIEKAFASLKATSFQLRSTKASDRINKLKALREWLLKHRLQLQQALYEDFQKPEAETDLTEYYLVKAEIDHAIRHLKRWVRPKRVKTPLTLIGSRSSVMMEPKGLCLILGPWNYPFSLMISPLVSAIAAGNAVILKPSEHTVNTSKLIKQLAEEVFDKSEVLVFEGGADLSGKLLSLPFDHIFFTGSPGVGKIVMAAAAANLTSVTLELGGKTPNVIDETANLKDAAEKIVFNKFLNAGQTCIAPDYILVQAAVHDEFVSLLTDRIGTVYEGNPEHMAAIINAKHMSHLKGLLDNAIENGARLAFGGKLNLEESRLSPTVLTNVKTGMKIMEEEIFGPLMPIMAYESLDEALKIVHELPKPLAFYFFSNNKSAVKRVLAEISCGGVCINDGNIQFSNNYLPFGGVNTSGLGKSHGYYGFRAFSNEKAILRQRVGFTSLKLLYPPYTQKVRKYVDLLLKWL